MNLKVTLCQTDIVLGSDNIPNIKGVEGSLYVLPEMWNTGFIINPEQVAMSETKSNALAWMKSFARKYKCAVCGSIPIKAEDETYRNRLYFTTKDETLYYDKHHLFTHAGEHYKYTRGVNTKIVEYGGFKFLLLVCYDLRFPVWSRYGRAGEYDAIIYVANWPASRMDAWDVLTRARAMENQCYVIAVNRVGDDPKTHYVGGSRIISPKGDILAECPLDKVSFVTHTMELDYLRKCRKSFKVLEDRD